ncbi:MAG TPA: exodeoxyribonuclease VII large subunit [Candidatus Acetothermia bacterium]|nr:exodeoxyribonuclease VII large subunit [Candidatus Acetothermia bacterium]HEX32260.1 exodeoxyribonuclease VII large subunit [Candidatus Acetothermia bacterium]
MNKVVRQMLEGALGSVWLRGEVSNLKRAASGHTYFTLKDDRAEISAVRFKSASPFLPAPTQPLEDGMEILAYGRATLYEPRGRYQFIVSLVQPAGLGALQVAFEQLKKKLDKEGLFDEAHKQQIPPYPLHVGVVTSPTGAAIRDIISVTSRRFPLAQLYIFPSAVQGEAAPEEIVSAIDSAQRFSSSHTRLDLLIVGRGGGSLEDLNVFNAESVARAIYACAIPVISAVGHEIDFTISDFVADRRAPTPSAAAERAFPDQNDLRRQLQDLVSQSMRRVRMHIDRREERMSSRLHEYVFRLPSRRIDSLSQRLDLYLHDLLRETRQALGRRDQALEHAQGLLALSDPRLPLRRGYSITRISGEKEPLRDARIVSPGMQIETTLQLGSITSSIEEVKTDEDR